MRAVLPGPAVPPAVWPARVLLQILGIIAAVCLGIWLLHRLAFIVLVLVVAGLFAYVMAPVVHFVERPIRLRGRSHHLPRVAAVLVAYLLVAATVAGASAFLVPRAIEQVHELVSRAPAYAQSILTWQHGWAGYDERWHIPVELRQGFDQSLVSAGTAAVESVRRSLLAMADALTVLPSFVLVPILAFFFLKDAASFRRAIVTGLPYQVRLRCHRLFEDLNATLAAYVRAQLLACLLVGSLCGVGFAVIGVPYPVPLAVLAGLLEFVPLVGPLLIVMLASVAAALRAPVLVFWVVGFLAVLRLVEDNVIYPRLIHRGIELHPLVIIVAVLAGAELDGIAGMFLAVPVVAISWVVCRHALAWRRADAASAEASAG